MSRFAILALCVQACLIQNVLSTCGCGVEQISYAPSRVIELPNIGCEQISYNSRPSINYVEQIEVPNYVEQISYQPASVNIPSVSLNRPSYGGAYGGSYGGSGTGEVSVSGDVGASGQTSVVGSVPVLGQVDFNGVVSAAGSVSITGQCGCGCY